MMRRWLFWGLAILFGWVLISRFAEIEILVKTLSQGTWQWVLTAGLLQVGYFLLFGWFYEVGLQAVGVASQWATLVKLSFAVVFLNATAPSGGMVGPSLIVDEAKRRGESGARATTGILLTMTLYHVGFVLTLLLGLVILAIRQNVTRLELTSAGIMLIYVTIEITLLSLGNWSPKLLLRLLSSLQNGINSVGSWVRRPNLLPAEWAEHNASDFTLASRVLWQKPIQILPLLLISLAIHTLSILTLYVLFLAFGQPAHLAQLVALYAMTILFSIISPTPNGIGIVETIMPAIYTSLGVETNAGIIINLAFRGITFWLPLVVGFFMLRRLPTFKPK